MNYLPFAWKLFLKNKKNISILLIIVSYFLLFPFIYQLQNEQSLKDKKSKEIEQIDLMIMPFTSELLEEGDEFVYSYDNLMNQRQLIVLQEVSLKMGQNEKYVEQELKLLEHRFELLENKMTGIADRYWYDLLELHQAYAEVTYLKDNGLIFNKTVLNNVDVWIVSIILYTDILFVVLLSLLTMDSYLERKGHTSIIRSLPVTENKLLWINYLLYSWIFQVTSIIATGISFLLSTYLFESGSFIYPKVIFQNGEFISIPSWQYVLLLIFGFLLLSNIIALFSLLINRVTQNAYINIVTVMAIFFSPRIAEFLNLFSLLRITYFFDLPRTLTGELAINYGIEASYFRGLIILVLLLVTIVLIFIVINNMTRYLKHISKKTLPNRKKLFNNFKK